MFMHVHNANEHKTFLPKCAPQNRMLLNIPFCPLNCHFEKKVCIGACWVIASIDFFSCLDTLPIHFF